MTVSSEFVVLCQTQIVLLTQMLEASISVVYLTEDLVGGTQSRLVPVAAYPESLVDYEKQTSSLLLPATLSQQAPVLSQLIDKSVESPLKDITDDRFTEISPNSAVSGAQSTKNSLIQSEGLLDQRQIVIPLIYEEVVFGFLVTRREHCGWEAWEQSQVEEIAKTLAIACVLDQRYQWSQREREREQMIHLQQHDLIDNLLHQFRNSLTALHTFGKLVLKRLLPGDRSHDLVNNITRETERLRELAQQMEMALNVGTIQLPRSLPSGSNDFPTNAEKLGDATLDTDPIDAPSTPLLTTAGLLPGAALSLERCLVEAILEPLLTSAREIAQEKGLTLHTHLSEELPPVWANAQALREVFTNLIENAIKYTPTGGDIWVLAETPDDSSFLEVSISDTGLGIPAEDVPHLFERHYRGAKAQGDIPGSGLGLAIVHSLIKQMHGKIQVFSPALPDKLNLPGSSNPTREVGSTFLVHLPLAMEEEHSASEG